MKQLERKPHIEITDELVERIARRTREHAPGGGKYAMRYDDLYPHVQRDLLFTVRTTLQMVNEEFD